MALVGVALTGPLPGGERPLRRSRALPTGLMTAHPRHLLLLCLVSFGAGCTLKVTPDRSSGGDAERHEASPRELNKLFLDSVNFDDGDATDYHYVVIGQRGILTVTCHFDNVLAKTSVTLRDAVGNVMATQYHNGEPRQVTTAKVKPGPDGTARYYVELKALEEGAISEYSCEAEFAAVVW